MNRVTDVKKIFDEDEDKLGEKTAERFLGKAKELLAENRRVVVSLPGGRSVQPFYRAIPDQAESLNQAEWKRLHFFWTDERLVHPESSESNYRLARDLFLDDMMEEGLIKEANVHRFPGETNEPGESVKEYSRELGRVSGGLIHLPVLGVGSDGHVGSLFPGSQQLRSEEDFLLVKDSPKPPNERVTVSPGLIKSSLYPFLFFIGEEKREAYRCFKNGENTIDDCPCKLAVAGRTRETFVITNLMG